MECIICTDSGSEPLQDNVYCSCKYKCHSSCWIDYVNSKHKLTCPLCRSDISVKSISKHTVNTPLIQNTVLPYTIEQSTTERNITYNEFINIIQQNNTIVNSQTDTSLNYQLSEDSVNLSISQKLKKVIIGLVILAIIISMIVICMKLL
jgi:hypothetical protein